MSTAELAGNRARRRWASRRSLGGGREELWGPEKPPIGVRSEGGSRRALQRSVELAKQSVRTVGLIYVTGGPERQTGPEGSARKYVRHSAHGMNDEERRAHRRRTHLRQKTAPPTRQVRGPEPRFAAASCRFDGRGMEGQGRATRAAAVSRGRDQQQIGETATARTFRDEWV